MPAPTNSFRGFRAIGIFLLFGAVMASLAGVTLVWRGCRLDRLWSLNPRAYVQLAPYGKAAGMAFLLLAATLVSAGVGWFRRRFWGWALAVTIVTIQVVGSLMNAILGSAFKGVIGLILAGILLYFLLRLQVRGFFANAARPKVPR